MKRLLSLFAFKRFDGMISILACSSDQLGSVTFPSGYFIQIRRLHLFPTPPQNFPHRTITSENDGEWGRNIVLCL